MRVEILDRLQPVVQQADRLVVYDGHGNPILLAVALSQDATITAKIGDPEFNDLLYSLGITKTALVSEYRPPHISLADFCY